MAFISSSKNSNGNEDDNTASIKYEDINHIDEDDIEEMDIKWNMALLSMRADMECRAPKSQNGGMRDNYRQGSKNHALVADEEALTEFAMMAKTSTDNEVFDNSLCSKACLSQVEGRLVEFKNQEIKFCEKIRGLEFSVECKTNRIKNLTTELETLKKEKVGLESKLTGLKSASKDLNNLLESQRSDKNKEGLGYSVVPPPPAQVYSPPKKDMSWTGLPEFVDDTITDYTT
uniref:Uncharacterized protein n=1 Tax=Tanacetum cinerariifolium TaxID=118510 RepID=A0A699JIF5_TANCI|nr:hypothetical protein [Tanacetum cinerariifolium]